MTSVLAPILSTHEQSWWRRCPGGHASSGAVLRRLADSLSRHNELEFVRGAVRVRVEVPDEVEIEADTEGGSLEVEISW